jgi:hypothetical protein
MKIDNLFHSFVVYLMKLIQQFRLSDFNPGLPEYEAGCLTNQQRRSVKIDQSEFVN